MLIGMEKLDEKPCRDLQKQLKTESAMFLSGDQPASVMTGIFKTERVDTNYN